MMIDDKRKFDMEFDFLTGDVDWRDYWGKWISPRMNNGDWDYWLVIEINNVEGCSWEANPTHIVSLSAVSPQAAGEEHVAQALASCGPDDVASADDEMIVEALHAYGISAMLWHAEGHDPDKLLEEAKQQTIGARSLFGFYMDGPKNRIGHTGWDYIRGDLSLETALANWRSN